MLGLALGSFDSWWSAVRQMRDWPEKKPGESLLVKHYRNRRKAGETLRVWRTTIFWGIPIWQIHRFQRLRIGAWRIPILANHYVPHIKGIRFRPRRIRSRAKNIDQIKNFSWSKKKNLIENKRFLRMCPALWEKNQAYQTYRYQENRFFLIKSRIFTYKKLYNLIY